MFKSMPTMPTSLGPAVSIAEPVAVDPVVVEPAVVESGLVELAVVEPAVVESGLVELAMVEPAVVVTAVVEPEVVEPEVGQHEVVDLFLFTLDAYKMEILGTAFAGNGGQCDICSNGTMMILYADDDTCSEICDDQGAYGYGWDDKYVTNTITGRATLY